MPKKFFEIAIDKLPSVEELEGKPLNEKRPQEDYSQYIESLPRIQQQMDQGETGRDILLTSDASTYESCYNPSSGNRIQIEFDQNGEVSAYPDGRHRIEAARQSGLHHIPAEINAPNREILNQLEVEYSSGRDLSQYNPREEFNELNLEDSHIPSNQNIESFSQNQSSQNQDEISMERFNFNTPKNPNNVDQKITDGIEKQNVEHPTGSEWVADDTDNTMSDDSQTTSNLASDNSQVTSNSASDQSYRDKHPEMNPDHADTLDRLRNENSDTQEKPELSGDYGQKSDDFTTPSDGKDDSDLNGYYDDVETSDSPESSSENSSDLSDSGDSSDLSGNYDDSATSNSSEASSGDGSEEIN
jgi:hypothetical protein